MTMTMICLIYEGLSIRVKGGGFESEGVREFLGGSIYPYDVDICVGEGGAKSFTGTATTPVGT